MAEKLTPEKIEEAARYYEDITSGKTPVLDKDETFKQVKQDQLRICTNI